MADVHAKPHHDYHLVAPSPWPAVGSIAAFIAAVGGISWMHHMYPAAPLVFGVGVIGILYTFIVWWRDVIFEARVEKALCDQHWPRPLADAIKLFQRQSGASDDA